MISISFKFDSIQSMSTGNSLIKTTRKRMYIVHHVAIGFAQNDSNWLCEDSIIEMFKCKLLWRTHFASSENAILSLEKEIAGIELQFATGTETKYQTTICDTIKLIRSMHAQITLFSRLRLQF